MRFPSGVSYSWWMKTGWSWLIAFPWLARLLWVLVIALTLLVGWQEGHPACNDLLQLFLKRLSCGEHLYIKYRINQPIQFYSNNAATLHHTVRRVARQHRDGNVTIDSCDVASPRVYGCCVYRWGMRPRATARGRRVKASGSISSTSARPTCTSRCLCHPSATRCATDAATSQATSRSYRIFAHDVHRVAIVTVISYTISIPAVFRPWCAASSERCLLWKPLFHHKW